MERDVISINDSGSIRSLSEKKIGSHLTQCEKINSKLILDVNGKVKQLRFW